MCGIIGYVGDSSALSVVLNGLKKLEYRGYDSAGVCVLDKELRTVKREGKIQRLEEVLSSKDIGGGVGMGHTRWATHGEPNQKNSHPHTDCKNEIAIIHNGIVENYHALKKLLKKEGHEFTSETDSEVLAHLIEKFFDGDLESAVVKALELVEGAFGLVVMHKDEEKLIAARRSSPLVLGVGKGEMFVASDVPAILKYTKQVVYLGDDEIASIEKNDYSVKNLDGEKLKKDVHEVKWNVEQIEKKGYKHFMLKEIFEQPKSIKNTLRGRIRDDKINLSLDIDTDLIERIIITACGTSWHTGLIAKYILESLTDIPVEVDYASEFRYRDPIIKKNDLVVAISQSGETADTLAALKKAKSNKAKTMGIVNVVGSSIAREVDFGIYLHAGPEIGVASTKAFTSQITAVILFALYLRQRKGKKIDNDLLEDLNSLPKKVQEILDSSKKIKKLAEKFKDRRNFLYLGRGLNFPVALEGALKLKEISYIHAEGYPAAEMKHGPIALVDENMPVVFVSPKDKTYDKIISNMEEIKARGGNVIALVNEEDENVEDIADEIIKVPKTPDELSPIVNTIPLQLLAYYIADMKGINVDKPRNLAKSVTVE